MAFMDSLFKKMNLVNNDDDENEEDDYDEYDDYSNDDDDDDDDETVSEENQKEDSLFENLEKEEKKSFASSYLPKKKSVNPEPGNAFEKPKKKSAAESSLGGTEICLIVPKDYSEASLVADALLGNRAVLLNLDSLDKAIAQKILDYVHGSCYTVGGKIQKVAKRTFIIAPPHVVLSGDFDQLVSETIGQNTITRQK